MELFETIQKSKLNLSPDYEIKSTTFNKKNFEYGYASIKRNNKGFYKELMKLIIELNPVIEIISRRKHECDTTPYHSPGFTPSKNHDGW